MEQEIHKEEHHDTLPQSKMVISTKTAIIVAVVVIIVALGWFYKGFFVAATVNGSPISRWSVLRQAEKQNGKTILDVLIAKKLVANEENSKGITLSDAELNAAIKKIEDQITAQGSTLDKALATQGMTREDFRESVIEQEKLKKLLADKLQVSDADVAKYIADNKLTAPAGQASTFSSQVKDYLIQQKMGTEANALVDSLKAKASINYFVSY